MAGPEILVCEKCGQELAPGSRFCNLCGAPTPAASPFALEEAAAKPIRPGEVLEGKWRIEKKLGQGGMGSVFLAVDVALDRKVAVKVLASELCKDEEFVARFEREARLTANLEHPNVVLIYAVGRHMGRPFIVMKWLPGESLARRVAKLNAKKETMGYPETQGIVREVCAGLAYIHSKGLIHRDIKTGNIFLGPDGRATILDFGILRDLKSNEGLTRSGVVMGTPHSVSPEQVVGDPYDHRSDLYAVGVLLYEMLTGAPPFDATNEFDFLNHHVRTPPPDPCKRNKALPPEAGKVLRRAIAKKPDERFQSGPELADALGIALGVDKEPEPEAPPEHLLPMPSTTAPLMVTGSLRARRSMLWVGIGLGAAAVLALAVVAALFAVPAPANPAGLPAAPLTPSAPRPVTPVPPGPPLPRPPVTAPKDPATPAEDSGDDEADGTDEAVAAAPANAPDGAVSPGLLKKELKKDPSKIHSVLHPRK